MRPKISPLHYILSALLPWTTSVAVAQDNARGSGWVEGAVYDQEDHEALPGASAMFDGKKAATAGADGRYRIELVAGEHKAVFRFVGYAPENLKVTVVEGQTVTLDAALKATTSQLDRVVVSAGRFEQKVGEVTQSLSILPAELIRDKNTTNLRQALDQVPGVVVIDEDPQIRAGSGFSYGAGSRVMLLADGMPLLSGDIGRPNWTFLPIEDVEQIEVIKGASSVLYGSAALSGVINVRNAWPTEKTHTRARIFAGVYDRPGQANANWWGDNPPLNAGVGFLHSQRHDRWDLVVSGNAFGDQGYVGPEMISADSLAKNPYALGPNGYNHRTRFNFATRVRNQHVDGLTYGLNGNVMKSFDTNTFLWNDLGEGLYRSMEGTTTTTDGTQFYLDPFINYTNAHGTRHSFKGRWYHQDFKNNNDQSNANHLLYGEYRFQRKMNLMGPLVLTAGVVSQHVIGHAVLYSGNEDGSGDNTATNAAGYLQVDKKLIADRLALSAGLRYEQFSVNHYRQARPVVRAGATYQVFEGTFLRASYGQGYRFPTIGERYITTSLGSISVYPNPGLEPETSENMEVGIKQGFRLGGISGYVDVVTFRQDFNNYVEFTFGQWGQDQSIANMLGLGFKSINTGRARITGTELELTGKGDLGKVELQFLLGYTYTLPVSTTPEKPYAQSVSTLGQVNEVTYLSTSYYTKNDILKWRVEKLFRADLGALRGKFSAGVSVRYNSHVRNIDLAFIQFEETGRMGNIGVKEWMETHTTGDWITDARLGYQITPQLKAALLVANLTNEVYAIRPLAIEAPRSYQVLLALEL